MSQSLFKLNDGIVTNATDAKACKKKGPNLGPLYFWMIKIIVWCKLQHKYLIRQ